MRRPAQMPVQANTNREICFPFENSFVCSLNMESIYEHRGTFVFLHGTVSDAAMWGEIAHLLSDRYRCVAVDFPGFGRSFSMEALKEAEGLGFWDRVRLVCELIDQAVAAGNEKIFLIGHEWGGAVAQVVALERGSQVSGLILLNSRSLGQLSSERVLGFTEFLLKRRLQRLLVASAGLSTESRRAIMAIWQDVFSRKARIRALCELEKPRPSRSTDQKSEKLTNLLERLSRLECPVLLLWGRNDLDLRRFENSEELVRIFPEAVSHFHETAGHWLHLEQPDWVAKMIREFVFSTEQLSDRKALLR
ncbi:MAG TPA: hypothetical protein DCS07_01995 [Bdellovibrionales bacterium]|nr:hypothetical protein [Bdellovibrionales bacterium]